MNARECLSMPDPEIFIIQDTLEWHTPPVRVWNHLFKRCSIDSHIYLMNSVLLEWLSPKEEELKNCFTYYLTLGIAKLMPLAKNMETMDTKTIEELMGCLKIYVMRKLKIQINILQYRDVNVIFRATWDQYFSKEGMRLLTKRFKRIIRRGDSSIDEAPQGT